MERIEQTTDRERAEATGDFDRKFENGKKWIKVFGGVAEVDDVAPENLKSKTPVLLAYGWGTTNNVAKIGLKKIFEDGCRAIAIEHPHRGGDMNGVSPELLEKYPTEQLRKALNIIDVLNAKNVGKVDAVAHSEGAINVAIAAMLHPEKFRNIIFFAPAGLIGEDSFFSLVKRASDSGKAGYFENFFENYGLSRDSKSKPLENGFLAVKEAIKHFWRNPSRRIKEALDISETNITELLRRIHDQGVGIIVIALADDRIFPIEMVMKNIGAEHDKIIDGFISMKGKHNDIVHHPDDAYKVILNAREMLEKKSRL